MHSLKNAMRLQAQRAMLSTQAVQQGIVTGYDPDAYAVKVELQPDGTPTGWIPLASPWIGNGWGLMCPPSIGDAVAVHFVGADIESAYVEGRYFNDIDRPLSVQSGEFWLVHASGAFLKLKNDGKLLINGQTEIDATAPVVNITATGNVSVTAGGNVTVTATGSATVIAATAVIQAASIALQNAGSALKALLNSAFKTWADTHVHSNGGGGSNTGAPTTTASSAAMTSTVQAE